MRATGDFGERNDAVGSEGTARGSTGEAEAKPPSSQTPSEAANEDFLFHLYRGSELLQDNRVHEAKEELERALHLQPRDAKGQDLLAVVYFRLGLYPRAIAIYEQLRRKNPRDTALLLNLALCYLKTGQAALAKRDLEALVKLNPNHTRAWGYLGLACDRLGELGEAEVAFGHGGHAQMARRMAEKRISLAPPPPEESFPSRDVRDAVATAFEELDAGELSFALAEPAGDPNRSEENWRAVELGQPFDSRAVEQRRTATPETMGGPGFLHVPQLGVHKASEERRPTLIVGVAPAAEEEELASLRVSAPRSPEYSLDESGAPSLRQPLSVAGVRVPAPSHKPAAIAEDAKGTMPPPGRLPTPLPPMLRIPTPLPAAERASYEAAPPSLVSNGSLPSHGPRPPSVAVDAQNVAHGSLLAFPEPGHAVLHPSGVALVRLLDSAGFAARLEAIRATTHGLTMNVVDRVVDGKKTGEAFGSIGSPVVSVSGDGQLVLGARAGRKLSLLRLDEETCFVREDVLVGWKDALTFENGRLATSESESVAIVQLRGRGAILLESLGEILALDVRSPRGMSVRREVLLGWFGRLVPRALSVGEAPCGQRGLVSFAGEGRILVLGT